MKRFLLLLTFCFYFTLSFAQLVKLTGKIQEIGNEHSIIGASIKYADKIYIIDETGLFSLDVQIGDSLYISSLGYESRIYKVQNNQYVVTIELKPIALQLQDIIIAPSLGQRDIALKKIDFTKKNINNSQEILRFVPGLFIGQHAGGGKAEQLFLRGFDIDHGTDVRITVDGIATNMASHAHGQGYADLHYVIPETINQINFGKGPYEADQGDFNTAGYVSLKTIDKLDQNAIKIEAGQFNTIRTLGLFKVSSKPHHNLFTAVEAYYTNGPFESPQRLKRFNNLIKHQYKGDRDEISTQLSFFYSNWNASGQIPDRAVNNGIIGFFGAIDPTEGGSTGRNQLSVSWKHKTSKNNVIEQQFFAGKYNFELFSNFTFFLNDPVNGDQIKQKENRLFYGYQGQYVKKLSLGVLPIKQVTGFQWRHDEIDDLELSRTINRKTVKEYLALGNGSQDNLSVYHKWNVDYNGWLIDLAFRADLMNFNYQDLANTLTSGNTKASVINPKFQLERRISRSTNLFFKVGQGFHSNDLRVAVANTILKPMPLAQGLDLGIFQRVGKSQVQLTLWMLTSNQEFVYVGDEAIVEPSGKTFRKGLEVSFRSEINRHFYTDHHFQFTASKSTDSPKEESFIPLAPKWLASGSFNYKNEKHSFQVKYRWMGDRPADERNEVIAKGYFITDFFIERKINKKQHIGLTIENIFNTRWKETQFLTESRLKDEVDPVSEIHFTPGTPFFARLQWIVRW